MDQQIIDWKSVFIFRKNGATDWSNDNLMEEKIFTSSYLSEINFQQMVSLTVKWKLKSLNWWNYEKWIKLITKVMKKKANYEKLGYYLNRLVGF